ncbi:MAG: nucleotide exchange factor GrpE [Melioribacteraceae bacterium]|nr:nucleotide exchange factor GrpE [Melioribacteraceae bacterium]
MSSKKDKKKVEREIEVKEEEKKEVELEDKADEEIESSDATKGTDITELEEKIKSLEDSLLRKVAEFENYKRRTENDQLNLLKYAAESFILKVLPVFDDLGRSVEHLSESNLESIKEGLKLVHQKFTKILDEQGIKKLDVKGKEFDVDFHEALMQQPSKDVEPNTVIEEIEAGYMYKDKVIKHAKVVVSQEMEEHEDSIKSDNGNEE